MEQAIFEKLSVEQVRAIYEKKKPKLEAMLGFPSVLYSSQELAGSFQ